MQQIGAEQIMNISEAAVFKATSEQKQKCL